jgi:ankyrin repeat protein
MAILSDSEAIVKMLLGNGVLANAPRSDPSPLLAACHLGTPGMLQAILKAGAEVNEAGRIFNCEDTALNTAVLGWHDKISKLALLLAHGADVNLKGHGGKSPLHMSWHKFRIAEYLLRNGADVDAQDDEGQTTMQGLMGFYAEDEADDPEDEAGPMTRLLLRYGADVEIAADDGSTAFIRAVETEEIEAVQVLLDHQTDVFPQYY